MNKGWLSLIGFFVLLILIFFGGPLLSKTIFKNYQKKIDRNGTQGSAIVYQKKTHKGNSVHFRYSYKGNLYKNHEQNEDLFNLISVGDTILIMLDTTEPGNSYILTK